MKSIISILLFIFFTVQIYSQNVKIDERNGFKDIKLSMHLNQFNRMKEIPSSNPNLIKGLWSIKDANLGYLFEDKIDYFLLSFEKSTQQLVIIDVVLAIEKPISDTSVLEKFKEINDRLIYSVGNHDSVTKSPIGLYWYGEEVTMRTMLIPEKVDYDEKGNLIGITSFHLIFLSNNFVERSTQDGF